MAATELGAAEAPKMHAVTESVPLPTNRKDLVQLFQKILELGRVQKVIVEIGHPVLFKRLVAEEDITEETMKEWDPLDEVRAGDLSELPAADLSPMETAMAAFGLLEENQAIPSALLVGDEPAFRKWFGLKTNSFFGLQVMPSQGLMAESAILAGVDPEEPDNIKFSVRFTFQETK
jgi:hypothetical protein